MKRRKHKWIALATLAGGTLAASSCDAVWQTLGLAFSIVDVWV